MTMQAITKISTLVRLLVILTLALAGGRILAESAGELAERADVFDRKLKAAEALELYLQVEKFEPDNAMVLVGIARQYRHLMADAPSTAEKRRLGNLALAYGERAAILAPKDSDAQLSIAITLGKMHSLESSKEQVEGSRRIKAAADRALALNRNNDLAWHLLGRWHEGFADLSTIRRGVGEVLYGKLPVSTNEEAARCFQKALQANPNRLMHYIELGIVYAKMGRSEEARKLIEKGLKMPNVSKDDPDYKLRGREALKKLS